ncbi:hypothetical protein K474DRAFT_1085165 [Panus rudis PR-1116 ss-1]|nr:hypothetical protein K474DRAFT_1085165 [Panus rudis PR-1116 ss-1]
MLYRLFARGMALVAAIPSHFVPLHGNLNFPLISRTSGLPQNGRIRDDIRIASELLCLEVQKTALAYWHRGAVSACICQYLRTFTDNTAAAHRLDSSVYPHFIGPPYLSEEDAQFVHSCDLQTLRGTSQRTSPEEGIRAQTLFTYLEDRMAALVNVRRAKKGSNGADGDTGRDFVLCTSHDLAPILQEAVGFEKQHFETRTFKTAYKKWEKEVRKGLAKEGHSKT